MTLGVLVDMDASDWRKLLIHVFGARDAEKASQAVRTAAGVLSTVILHGYPGLGPHAHIELHFAVEGETWCLSVRKAESAQTEVTQCRQERDKALAEVARLREQLDKRIP